MKETLNFNKMENVTFGTALEAVKQGKRAAREGWNGKGMFIFQRPEDTIPYETVVGVVKSIPQSLRDHLYFDAKDSEGKPVELKDMPPVKFTAYLCLYAADRSIVNGWLASQTDMLSEDWNILD